MNTRAVAPSSRMVILETRYIFNLVLTIANRIKCSAVLVTISRNDGFEGSSQYL